MDQLFSGWKAAGATGLNVGPDGGDSILHTAFGSVLEVKGPFNQVIEAWQDSASRQEVNNKPDVLLWKEQGCTLLSPTSDDRVHQLRGDAYYRGKPLPTFIRIPKSTNTVEMLLLLKDERETISKLESIGYVIIDEKGTDGANNLQEDAHRVMPFKGMRHFVKAIDSKGGLTKITVESVYTVGNVQQSLFQEIKTLPETKQLTFRGKPLEDSLCLEDCGIEDGDTLLMLRTPGKEVEYL